MSHRPHSGVPVPAPLSSPCFCSGQPMLLPNFQKFHNTASHTGIEVCHAHPNPNWMMHQGRDWVEESSSYDILILFHYYWNTSMKRQRLRRTRHQWVLKTIILHHFVATIHPGQAFQISVAFQINADNNSLGARLDMRRKGEQSWQP